MSIADGSIHQDFSYICLQLITYFVFPNSSSSPQVLESITRLPRSPAPFFACPPTIKPLRRYTPTPMHLPLSPPNLQFLICNLLPASPVHPPALTLSYDSMDTVWINESSDFFFAEAKVRIAEAISSLADRAPTPGNKRCSNLKQWSVLPSILFCQSNDMHYPIFIISKATVCIAEAVSFTAEYRCEIIIAKR